jgi:hypothetical protein
LTLAAKSMCRRLVAKGQEKPDVKEADKLYKAALGSGDHALSAYAKLAILPITVARDGIETSRKPVEKRLAELAKTLPVAPWIDSLRGVAIGSLAAIVGEAGDVGSYRNPSCLWKRMGLAVLHGERQRRVTDKALAIEHGYSPSRRSVMWNIGDCIIKAGGELREIYDKRKRYEIECATAQGLIVAPAAKIPEKDKAQYRSEGHVHNRAKRYLEKQFLKMLWQRWRAANRDSAA